MRGLLLQSRRCREGARSSGSRIKTPRAPAVSSSRAQNELTVSTVSWDLSQAVACPVEDLQEESLASHCLSSGCRPARVCPVRDDLHQLQPNELARFRRVPSL